MPNSARSTFAYLCASLNIGADYGNRQLMLVAVTSSMHSANSVLEFYQVRVSLMALILAILVRSPAQLGKKVVGTRR